MATAEDFATGDNQCSGLLDAIHEFTGRFVAYPSEHAHVAHVLWMVHTHLMDAWESTPRLAFLSPEPASGKTRALEITELLVPNAVEAINVTPAYLFRKVGADEGKPTILYDEIDTVFGPKAKENEEIRGLLNAGHRRGAVAGRCVVHGKRVETEEISAYCAVALAGLGWLPDTILTRSVIIRMRRRAPGEKITAFRRRVHAPEGHALRDRLAAWAAQAVDAITAARPKMPTGIEDRDADMWEPLLAIADAVGGNWPQGARDAAVALVGAAKDAEPSLGLRLLADLKTVFDTSTLEALPTAVILARLIALPESPWGDLRGRPITDRTLASKLRQYGVRSRDIRIDDKSSPLKGYAKADLHDAWLRYLSPCNPTEARQARQARHTPENGGFSQENIADVADGERDGPSERDRNNSMKSSPVAHVADVADVRGNGGSEPRTCAQCNAGGGPLLEVEGVWLHSECRGFWLKAQNGVAPPDDGIPDSLRRCAHCNRSGTLGQVVVPDRPGTVWLHRECEGAWLQGTPLGANAA
jgi:Protein of unknown function (DUF3631)